MKRVFLIAFIITTTTACTPSLDKAIDFSQGNAVDIVDTDIASVDASTSSVDLDSQVKVNDDVRLNINLAFNELKDLEGNELLAQNLGNCAPYASPQPYAFSGTSAGFSASSTAFSAYEHSIVLNSELKNLKNINQDVAIIVVDDFAGASSSVEGFNISKDIIVDLFDANDSTTWPIHGDVVLNQINLLLAASDYQFIRYNLLEVEGARAYWSHPNGNNIVIEALDFNNAQSQNIAKRLESSISNLQAVGYKNIVVNMSFAIVPCSVWNDYVAHIEQYKTIEEYAQAIYKKNEAALSAKIDLDIYGQNVVLPELIFKLTTAINPLQDPLYKSLNNQKDVVFVASAGNFGNDFSTYPAAYPNVISVSALDLATKKKADYANTGNVLLAGGDFILEFMNNGISKSNISYKGSSFAAPELSYIAALNLASGKRCQIVANKIDISLAKFLDCN
ncbi:MAG TPA: hypothetical protein ENK21_01900 [Trueperaceae bacterium]|nr:hypothetical protein [Trueperaceae bacterium]